MLDQNSIPHCGICGIAVENGNEGGANICEHPDCRLEAGVMSQSEYDTRMAALEAPVSLVTLVRRTLCQMCGIWRRWAIQTPLGHACQCGATLAEVN